MELFKGRRILIIQALLIIAIGITGCTKKDNSTTPIPISEEDENTSKVFERSIGVVKNVDSVNKKIFFYDIEDEELIPLKIDGAVDLNNKYGETITLAQIKNGDMVKVKYEQDTLIPEYVNITAEVWEYDNITGVNVDTDNKVVRRGNDSFEYNEELMVLYNGKAIEIGEITSTDRVTLKGYKDKLWVVIMENPHGYVTLKNHDYFIGGTLEIGSNIIETITEDMSLPVEVGVFDVVIDKEGNEPIQKQIMIEKDQEVIIDLATDSPKEGELNITVSESDARVYINGERQDDLEEPIKLPFGDYVIVAEKDGYSRYEETITLEKPSMDYNISLEKKSKYLHVNEPINTEIYIDGDYIGNIPVSVPIEPGDYSITLRNDGYYSKLYNITIQDNERDSFMSFPDLVEMQDDNDSTGDNHTGDNDTGGDTNNPPNDAYDN
ncbi:MAG: PEGA domain-containing protein [Eubacteriales bacterium]